MKKNNNLSTKIAKGPVIFTIIGLVSSIIVITLCAIFSKKEPLAIAAIIFFAILAVAAIVTLFGLLLDYAYISDDYLYTVYIFKRNKILISDIGKIKLANNVYTIFDKKNKKVGTINAMAPGNDKIIIYLDKCGVKLT